jgi:hypothetical protein
MLNVNKTDLVRHHEPVSSSDRLAFGAVAAMIWIASKLFGRRYGRCFTCDACVG